MTLDVMGGTVQLLPNMAESTLLREQSVIQGADVVVVVAAADSGLPAAVAAMVHCPVIAVPTHAGFSATRTAQVAPASAHTNTCVAGMAVVRAPPLSLSPRVTGRLPKVEAMWPVWPLSLVEPRGTKSVSQCAS